MGDGVADGLPGDVEVRVKEADDGVDVTRGEGDDEIDGAVMRGWA